MAALVGSAVCCPVTEFIASSLSMPRNQESSRSRPSKPDETRFFIESCPGKSFPGETKEMKRNLFIGGRCPLRSRSASPLPLLILNQVCRVFPSRGSSPSLHTLLPFVTVHTVALCTRCFINPGPLALWKLRELSQQCSIGRVWIIWRQNVLRIWRRPVRLKIGSSIPLIIRLFRVFVNIGILSTKLTKLFQILHIAKRNFTSNFT